LIARVRGMPAADERAAAEGGALPLER
jgi:hypothetical protein